MNGSGAPRFRWVSGTTITVDGERVRVSIPTLGRAWRFDAAGLVTLLLWMTAPSEPAPELVLRLLDAGLLINDVPDLTEEEAWGPVRRFHTWAQHDYYLDGADPSGLARAAALARFSAEEITKIRSGKAHECSQPGIADDLADIAWVASSRMRANRARVAAAKDARELLFSYGAAHNLLVIDPAADLHAISVVDVERMGWGRRVDGHPGSLLHAAGLEESARGIAVLGSFEDYQRRYRHEKAMRGFHVDGGRLLGELARAVASRYGSAMVTDGPLPPAVTELAGLDPSRQVVVGIATIGQP